MALENELKKFADASAETANRLNQKIEDLNSRSNFVFTQAASSSSWVINHPLKKRCSVTITDTAGTVVEGKITINNGEQIVVEFNAPFSGVAFLN